MPHLDAAYNLARWLTRSGADAEDMVQEAYLKAFRLFDGYAGGSGKAWILTIVRHTCFTWLRRHRPGELLSAETLAEADHPADPGPSAEALLVEAADHRRLNELLAALPAPFREILVLRELEGLSYKEIAMVTAVAPGTVMSRLSRARVLLREAWFRAERQEAGHGM